MSVSNVTTAEVGAQPAGIGAHRVRLEDDGLVRGARPTREIS